jgi:hypothetical protein
LLKLTVRCQLLAINLLISVCDGIEGTAPAFVVVSAPAAEANLSESLME